MKYPICLFLAFYICGCSTFTNEKMMKVRQGMTSDEVLKMFGQPKSISQAVCGSKTGSPWNCTTWEYESFFGDETASFTFSGEPDSYVLNNFSINR